ncbi:MAG: hypothetical protein ABWX96_16005 [Propionibacteriaceae bacterium]
MPHSFDTFSSALVDGITDAVASPPDAQARAEAVCGLVREIYETMEWVHGANPESYELASLRGLVAAALEHQERMIQDAAQSRLSA